MADNRLWYKNDVGYLDNPKVAELVETNPNAVLLHQACIAYSKQHGTDGLVLVLVAMRRACAKQCDLDAAVASGLLEVVDDRHVLVHDYLEHQTSAEEDRNRSDKAKRAADARWGKKSDARGNAPSIPLGNAARNAGSNAEKSREEKNSSSELRPDIQELIDHLDQHLQALGKKTTGHTIKNQTAARLLVDKDQRTPERVRAVIDWAVADPFWQDNILSMAKLREKYDQLEGKARKALQGNVRPLYPGQTPVRYVTPPPKDNSNSPFIFTFDDEDHA